MNNATRPVFKDLTKIQFPITAIVSILHRISGVVIFLFLPVSLWMLQESLASRESFDKLAVLLQQPIWQFVTFSALAAITYHALAGIRHMLMDLGFAESKAAGKTTAVVLLVLFLFALTGLGVWLLW